MNKPTIVIVAFNRPEALLRVFESLERALLEGISNVKLIISIDGGGPEKVCELAYQYIWNYGPKEIICHKKNLGLRKHILSCGDMTEKYGSIIILEDDCYVSPNFYHFASQTLEAYGDDINIAGISLYTHPFNENTFLPFQAFNDGYDTYFMQVPSSLGQVWTIGQWQKFRKWYADNPDISFEDKLPANVIRWPKTSWKKYYYKYMVAKGLYFVYPAVSHLTNFSDVGGTHFVQASQLHQAPIENRDKGILYKLVSFQDSLNKYDGFFELETNSYILLGTDIDPDTMIDLNGSKPLNMFDHQYVLSVKDCKNPIKSYQGNMLPIQMNIVFNNPGDFFHYAHRNEFGVLKHSKIRVMAAFSQVIGFNQGKNSILETKTYKLGFYLLNPWQICIFLNRKLKSFFKNK